jgi:hypothetical protein
MPRQTNDFPEAFPFFLRLGHATDVIFSEAQLGLVFGALQRFSIELAPLLPCLAMLYAPESFCENRSFR